MIIGGNNVISFKTTGESDSANDIYSITINKIKYLLGTNVKEVFVHLDKGANMRYFNHKTIKNSTKDLLKKMVTLIVTQELPYVTVMEITDMSADKVLGFSVIISINEQLFTVPILT
jgi:hypothetical protein